MHDARCTMYDVRCTMYDARCTMRVLGWSRVGRGHYRGQEAAQVHGNRRPAGVRATTGRP
jgi:hypothetical protein